MKEVKVRRRYRYGVKEVAMACGMEELRVRRDRKSGIFDLGDLVSVSRYVIGHVLVKEAGCTRRT